MRFYPAVWVDGIRRDRDRWKALKREVDDGDHRYGRTGKENCAGIRRR